jgi:uncharacterized protein
VKNYRADVSQHFERTAELFDKVTADYRSLYEHLAMSARQLGAIPGESGRSVEARLAEPEQRRLGDRGRNAAGAVAAAAETPASDCMQTLSTRIIGPAAARLRRGPGAGAEPAGRDRAEGYSSRGVAMTLTSSRRRVAPPSTTGANR